MKKIILSLALVIFAVVGGALWWLSGNLDAVVKKAIEVPASEMTKARVGVGEVKIAPVDGKGAIGGLVIGNPPGFKTPHLLKAERIEVEIDIATVTKDVVLVRRIAVVAPDVIYEKGDTMTNIDAIQKNIAAYLGPSDTSKQGKKLIVEELIIRNAKAQASAAFMGGKTVTVPLPDITLKNVGRAKGGLTPGELGQEVAAALKAKLTSAVSFDRLMKSTGETLDKAGSAIKGLFK